MNPSKLITIVGALTGALAAHAQIPDLITAFDAGGRSLGMGGALGTAGSSTRATLDNPAGIAYSSASTVGLTFRNLSESRTTISGNFRDQDFRTDGKSGNRSLTHAGITMPMGKLGVLGIAYTVGGFIRDTRVGDNLQDGELTVRNYLEITRAKTDFLTISLARARADYTSAWGIGLVIANHNTRNFQTYRLFRSDGSEVSTGGPLDNRGNSNGIGVVVGMQMTPANNPNQSFGVSLRSPISLTGGDETAGYYRRIPAKASAGYVQRMSNSRRSQDYMLFGLQGDAYFGGQSDKVLSRDKMQVVVGTGLEYHLRQGSAFIPIRLGYRTMSRGGDGFTPVSGISFGLGYKPDNADYFFDLDFASSSNGGMDMSLSLSYRFGK